MENLKKFQKETLGMRDELMANRAELANEYAKLAPDETRIAYLQKQMIDTRTKIQKTSEKYDLPARQRGYGRGYGSRHDGGIREWMSPVSVSELVAGQRHCSGGS